MASKQKNILLLFFVVVFVFRTGSAAYAGSNNSQSSNNLENSNGLNSGLDNATPKDDLSEVESAEAPINDQFNNQIEKNNGLQNEKSGAPKKQKKPKKPAKNKASGAAAASEPNVAPSEAAPVANEAVNPNALLEEGGNTVPVAGEEGFNQAISGDPGVVPAQPTTEVQNQSIPLDAPPASQETNALSTQPPTAATEEAAVSAPTIPQPNEFGGAPPIPGTLRNVADGEAPEEYSVEYGDTLFDICDQLIDEPGYWPKLWSMNPEIKNPHFIFPGMKLKFYPGDSEAPPFLQVVSEEDVIPIDKGDLKEAELVKGELPNMEKAVEGFPPIEVIRGDQLEIPPEIENLFMIVGKKYNGDEVRFFVPGFIFSEEKESLGTVIVGEDGEEIIGSEKSLVIKSESGVEAGSTYSVLRYKGKVSNPNTGSTVGHLYYFTSNIKTTKRLDEGIVKAEVTDGQLGVQSGDIVVSYISTLKIISPASTIGAISSGDATVVGFGYPGKTLDGAHGFVFLDQGSGKVSEGQFYQVYQKLGFSESKFNSNPSEEKEPVGIIRIIHTTEAGSVGWIVKNSREVKIGASTGKG